MAPFEYYPSSLYVVVMRGGKGLDNTEAGLYCHQCSGKEHEYFGHFLRYLSLREALKQVELHDPSHKLTIVDEGSCGFGMW